MRLRKSALLGVPVAIMFMIVMGVGDASAASDNARCGQLVKEANQVSPGYGGSIVSGLAQSGTVSQLATTHCVTVE
jgi:hypothetical protein